MHSGTVSALTWSLNGRRILSASHDGTVATWNVEAGTLVSHYVHKLLYHVNSQELSVGKLAIILHLV